ncbi:MAG: superoxide dismutase family protein [Methylotenera sp.]|jgi:superoxide dismutase, Cu-Zn family|nr:superoxide dismutase family protein [Methylotenera sp.]
MKPVLFTAALLAACGLAQAAEVSVRLATAEKTGAGAEVGTVRIVETPYGLAFYPDLKGLPPGQHGFHVHEKPSCGPADNNGTPVPAGAAGGHLDPAGSKKHGEPWGDGHLGDLPPLFVAADGSATAPVLGPRLKLADVKNRALMVHAGGDNHADHPAPLGGGGPRVACGVIGG